MLKAFGKLWRKSAKRIVKAQVAQQKKLNKELVKKILLPVKKPRPAVKFGSVATAPLSSQLGDAGWWSRSYFSYVDRPHGQLRRIMYWLFVPKLIPDHKSDQQKSMPLVVMLHGCDQTASDFASGTRMNRLAARHGFAVLYPQPSVTAHVHQCWDWYQPEVQNGGGESALLVSVIQYVGTQQNIDRSRIYVAGLSAGAAMAQTLALGYPDMIAAIGSHSGPVYGMADSRLQALSVMQQGCINGNEPMVALLLHRPDFPVMPIMIIQGGHDAIVRPVNGTQLAQQFRAINRMSGVESIDTVLHRSQITRDAYRMTDYRCGKKSVIRLCEVAHLGHAWSGGDAALRYNTADGPDASALLWQFFKQQRRQQRQQRQT